MNKPQGFLRVFLSAPFYLIFGVFPPLNVVRKERLIIPDSIINIDDSAFQGCEKLISIDIPDSVIYIGKYAFGECNNLLTVSLGKNVIFIGADAFWGCSKILTITSNNPIPPHLETRMGHYASEMRNSALIYPVSAFDSISNKCRLVIPDEFIAAYKDDTEWSKFFNARPPIDSNAKGDSHLF